METKLAFVTITLYEYNKLNYDIDELKKQVEYYKNDKDFCYSMIKNNHETNDYFRESASYWRKRASDHHESTEKLQSKCKQLIEEMQCKIIEEIIKK